MASVGVSRKPLRDCIAVAARASSSNSTKAMPGLPGIIRTSVNPACTVKSIESAAAVQSTGKFCANKMLLGGALASGAAMRGGAVVVV